jgi:hypothetical protein
MESVLLGWDCNRSLNPRRSRQLWGVEAFEDDIVLYKSGTSERGWWDIQFDCEKIGREKS